MIKKLFTNKYFIILLLVTFLLILSLIFSNTIGRNVLPSDNLLVKITVPVQRLFTGIATNIGGFFNHFGDIAALREENEKLQQENSNLESKIRRYQNYEKENTRLKSMLDIQDTYTDFETVAANVIGKDTGTWFQSFIIDKGTKNGLTEFDTVITPDGLVGYISALGSDWAQVTAIIDSLSTVAVMVSRTDDLATVDGDIDLLESGLCKMTYIAKGSNLTVGDLVETSGLGGTYPKGISVGKIKEIHLETQGISQYAVIEPSVNFGRIYEVFVITNYDAKR